MSRKAQLSPISAVVRLLLKLFFRVKIYGSENLPREKEGLLIISNHLSYIDSLFLYFFLPLRLVHTTNSNQMPPWVIRLLSRFVEIIVFDNTSSAPLKEAIQALKEGKNVSIFPENRPSSTTTMMKLYDSAGLIANKARAKIVTVSLEGLQHSIFSSSKLLPKNMTLSVLVPHQLKASRFYQFFFLINH